MQFPPSAPFRKRVGVVSHDEPQLSYSSELAVDRCTMLSSPTFRAGLESAVHNPFRRHSTYSAVTIPEVGSEIYDHGLVPWEAGLPHGRQPRPTDLHTGIRCSDTSYPHTTLSLAICSDTSGTDGCKPSWFRL